MNSYLNQVLVPIWLKSCRRKTHPLSRNSFDIKSYILVLVNLIEARMVEYSRDQSIQVQVLMIQANTLLFLPYLTYLILYQSNQKIKGSIISQRFKRKVYRNETGPGQYDARYHTSSRRKKQPKFGFGYKARKKLDPHNFPGPGSYFLQGSFDNR